MNTDAYVSGMQRTIRIQRDRINALTKRVPGHGAIDDLERIALIVDDEDPAEADLLRRIADRLRDLRVLARGEGRRELNERLTREALKRLTREDCAPFAESADPAEPRYPFDVEARQEWKDEDRGEARRGG